MREDQPSSVRSVCRKHLEQGTWYALAYSPLSYFRRAVVADKLAKALNAVSSMRRMRLGHHATCNMIPQLAGAMHTAADTYVHVLEVAGPDIIVSQSGARARSGTTCRWKRGSL
jgi:hypothetical protein